LTVGTRVELGCRLDFDHEHIVDDHVEALAGELFTLVHDTNACLTPYLMAPTS
jgi:hypothetical protein